MAIFNCFQLVLLSLLCSTVAVGATAVGTNCRLALRLDAWGRGGSRLQEGHRKKRNVGWAARINFWRVFNLFLTMADFSLFIYGFFFGSFCGNFHWFPASVILFLAGTSTGYEPLTAFRRGVKFSSSQIAKLGKRASVRF